MPKNRCKNPYYLIFYYLCNWNVPSLKGTETAFRNRESIQKEI